MLSQLLRDAVLNLGRSRLSAATRRRLRRRLAVWPPVGALRLGSLDRLTPVSDVHGFDRGTPVDRHYIEHFLTACAERGDLAGRVLEVGEDRYASRLGRPASVDILDVDPANAAATVHLELGREQEELPGRRFDCIVCTQTLLLIHDVRTAVAQLHDLLAPGGVLLVTVPGISPVMHDESGLWADEWRFTQTSCRRLFGERFGREAVEVSAHGNVLAATAFLYGMAAEELGAVRLEPVDPRYELVITVRARR